MMDGFILMGPGGFSKAPECTKDTRQQGRKLLLQLKEWKYLVI